MFRSHNYDEIRKIFKEFGFPDWQNDGSIEMFKLIDSGSPVTDMPDLSAFTQITGEQPTDLKCWLAKHSAGFQ